MHLIPAGRQAWVVAKIVLARRAAEPTRIEMPTNPVRRAPVAVVRDRVLRFVEQVIERDVYVHDGVRRIAHR